MPMKTNGPGGCNCCDSRPCCAVVWDSVRAAYRGIRGTIQNVSSVITDDELFVEQISPGYYQCAAGNSIYEMAPPAEDSYPVTSGITRVKSQHVLDPSTGIWTYKQSGASFQLIVSNCNPAELEVNATVGYRLRYTAPTTPPDWEADGFTCVTHDGYECDVWERTDGNILTRITRQSSTDFDILADYQARFASVAAVPFPLTVAPYYNPANISVLVEWIP